MLGGLKSLDANLNANLWGSCKPACMPYVPMHFTCNRWRNFNESCEKLVHHRLEFSESSFPPKDAVYVNVGAVLRDNLVGAHFQKVRQMFCNDGSGAPWWLTATSI